MGSAKPRIAIIIPNWNGASHLEYCIPSLLQAAADDVPIAVVDDRSTDASKVWMAAFAPRISWVDNKRSQGFAGSVNTGILWALKQGADFIVVANNDIKVDPLAITRMQAFLQSHAGNATLGILGFREFNPPFQVTDLPEKTPALGLGALVEKDCVPGCYFLLSAATVKAIGLLDESYFMYGEDNDYFFRVRKAGFSILQSDYPIWHRGEGSSQGSMKASWLAYRNALRFAVKNESFARIIRTFLSLANQAINPFLRFRTNDPSYIRLSRHSRWTNISLLIGSLFWNLWHLFDTIKARQLPLHGEVLEGNSK